MRTSQQAQPVCVFLGPSLSPRTARQLWSTKRCRRPLLIAPPIKQGDLVRLAESELAPAAVGIVDGVLRQEAAVSHKEILYALKQGIWVYGASSMGALRAAECDRYGMIGVGRVYEDFRDGRLEDDDEVVVIHESDPDAGRYTSHSEPLCNIRYTLERAVELGVVAPGFRDESIAYLKALPFWERTLARALDHARASSAWQGACRAFEQWLHTSRGYVDQKRLDAMSLIDTLAGLGDDLPPPPTGDWDLADTYGWQLIRRRALGMQI